MRKPTETEFITNNVVVHDKECNSCKAHKMDVMLSFKSGRVNDDINVYDLFLTTKQAKKMIHDLLVIFH